MRFALRSYDHATRYATELKRSEELAQRLSDVELTGAPVYPYTRSLDGREFAE